MCKRSRKKFKNRKNNNSKEHSKKIIINHKTMKPMLNTIATGSAAIIASNVVAFSGIFDNLSEILSILVQIIILIASLIQILKGRKKDK